VIYNADEMSALLQLRKKYRRHNDLPLSAKTASGSISAFGHQIASELKKRAETRPQGPSDRYPGRMHVGVAVTVTLSQSGVGLATSADAVNLQADNSQAHV
jgi:hypothetical protein